MHSFGQARWIQVWTLQDIPKTPNRLNPPSKNVALLLRSVVLIVRCHHRCMHLWPIVHLVWIRRIWHPLHRPRLFNRHCCLAKLRSPLLINSTIFVAKVLRCFWKEMDQKEPPFNQWTHGWRPRFWTPRFIPNWTMLRPTWFNKCKNYQLDSFQASLVFSLSGAWNQLKQPSTRRRRPLNCFSFLMNFENDYAPNAGASLRYAPRRLLSCLCTWLAHCRNTIFHHTDTCFLRIYVVLEHFIASLRLYTFHAKNSTLFAYLATLGIDPRLSFDQYHSPSQVYARMPMTNEDPMRWYIGSTIRSPLFREQSRIRKYTQLEKGTDAFFEPALRIWYAKKNFFSFFVTPIRIIPDSIQLRAQELALIKQFRPKLNHPHCNPLLKKLRICLQQYVLPTCSTGLLGNKLLERFFEDRLPVDRADLAILWSKPDELFNILYWLGSNSRDKFEVSKLLRSNSATLPFLYLLYRYCQLIDEPHRTQAKKLLVRTLEFHGGHQPPSNVPMQLLSLSIDTTPIFRDWLREFLQHHSNLFPWFHVPTTQIVQIKNPTWKTKVFNFHRFLKQWDPDQPPTCQCGGRDFFPSHTVRQTGHLFASRLDIFPYTCLAHLNLEDCAWPTGRQWMEQGQQTFYRWKERWKLPNRFKHLWDLALHQAWESHLFHLRKHTGFEVIRHKTPWRNSHDETFCTMPSGPPSAPNLCGMSAANTTSYYRKPISKRRVLNSAQLDL